MPGERGDFYYHYCFKLANDPTPPAPLFLTRPPPPLAALKCPAFSTHLKPPLALLDAARLSSNLRAPANPLHCSSPVSASPLNGLTLCGEDGERLEGGAKERRPLAARESAPGWAGFLDML